MTIIVNAPPTAIEPTVSLGAGSSRISLGGSTTLSWSSTDATSCTASGAWSGSKATSGSESVSLSGPATLTLTCVGDGGSVSSSVTYSSWGRRWLRRN